MIEKIWFNMPSDLERTIAAISVVQEYKKYRHLVNKASKDYELQITIATGDLWYFNLRVLQPSHWTSNKEMPSRSAGYDLVFDFDVPYEELYQWSLPTQKHMVQTYGMQLAVDPPSVPDLSSLLGSVTRNGCVWIDERLDWRPGSDIAFDTYAPKMPTTTTMEANDTVVGIRNGITYLACALGLPVIEIYKPDRHRRWISKWAHKKYAMVYGNEFRNETITAALESLWAAFPAVHQESKTPTEPPQSIAVGVAGQ